MVVLEKQTPQKVHKSLSRLSLLTCPNCIIGWSSLSRVVCEKKGKDLDGFISETKLPYYYYNKQLLSNLLIIYWQSAENHTQARISPIWRT